MVTDGYYNGVIREAWTEAGDSGAGLYMCFLVATDEVGEQIARHPTEGDYAEIGESVAKHLGLDYPKCLRNLMPCVGKAVRLKVKTKIKDGTPYQNAYIVTPREKKPANEAQIEMTIAKIEAGWAVLTKKDDEPF